MPDKNLKNNLLRKKGIEPVVTTVLLVGIAIVVSATFFLWGRGYQESVQEKQGAIAEKSLECNSQVSFIVTNVDKQKKSIELSNQGIKIDAFTLRIIGDQTEVKEVPSPMASNSKKELSYQSFTIQKPSSLEIIPKLSIAKGLYQPCSEKLIKVKL